MTYGEFLLQILDSSTDVVTAAYNTGFEAGKKYVMEQLQNSSYNKSIVRQVHIAALHKEQQQIAEAVEKAERGDDG